jgi:outer membrane protein OmpA-like peptidoglycan-associated protein
MFKLRRAIIWTAAVPILMLATSGCATKKYVSQQVSPVNAKVANLQKQTDDRIAYLNNQRKTDMSQINERFATTDQKLSEVAQSAHDAQGTASRAMDEAETTGARNSAAIDTLGAGVANALNFQLVDTGDVMFGFNKATLTPQAKTELDAMAQKALAQPRTVIELVGFTSKVGSPEYNLGLSRRRAEAVQRYLIQQKVPLRSIHIVGLGQEAPPEGMAPDMSAMNPNKPSRAEMNRLSRRVHISVYGAGDITSGNASRSQ